MGKVYCSKWKYHKSHPHNHDHIHNCTLSVLSMWIHPLTLCSYVCVFIVYLKYTRFYLRNHYGCIRHPLTFSFRICSYFTCVILSLLCWIHSTKEKNPISLVFVPIFITLTTATTQLSSSSWLPFSLKNEWHCYRCTALCALLNGLYYFRSNIPLYINAYIHTCTFWNITSKNFGFSVKITWLEWYHSKSHNSSVYSTRILFPSVFFKGTSWKSVTSQKGKLNGMWDWLDTVFPQFCPVTCIHFIS